MKAVVYNTFQSNMLSDQDVEDHYNPSIRLIDVERSGSAHCGFQLTRGKWDPYPWVKSVEPGTAAFIAGLKPGDCLLEVNGEDIIGQRVSEVAEIVKSKPDQVSLLLWNAGADPQCTPEAVCCGPMPTNLQRLSACMSTILAFLECPVCLDTTPPPTYQCENGHLICIRCRTKSERCPVCRVRFTRGRSLLSDQVYSALVEAFNLKEEPADARAIKMQQIFRLKKSNKNKNKNIPDIKITHYSRTNKILEQLSRSGKATSFDNLMHHTSKLISRDISPNEFNVDNSLKTKSLSTHDIYPTDSPPVSSKKNSLEIGNISHNRPASYHGSFDNLQNKMNDLTADLICLNNNDRLMNFYCPFKTSCAQLLKGSEIIEHFQMMHDGPLIQFFKPNIKVSFSEILKYKDLCYVIQIEANTFFLRLEIIDDVSAERVCNNNGQNVVLWTWCMGNKKISKLFEMQVKVIIAELSSVIFSAHNSVCSLNSVKYKDILDLGKAVFLNVNSLKFASEMKEIVLDITVLKSDCD